MRYAAITALATITLFLLPGCSKENDGRRAGDGSSVAAWSGEAPFAPGWLSERLPENALVYQRIPNPLAMILAPKGNVYQDALASDAHVRNFLKARDGLVANVLDRFDILDDIHLRLLVQHLRSPLEIAALGPDATSANFGVLATFMLDLDSTGDFEDLLGSVLANAPGIGLTEPLDSDGYGLIGGIPLPGAIHFDSSTGRVLCLIGPAVDVELLKTRVGSLATGTDHPMYAMQDDIDQSGHGYFFWANPKDAMRLGQLFMPPEAWQTMHANGLDQVDSLAFGLGVANGKGRLRIAAAVPDVPARQFLPVVANRPQVRSVGAPDFVLMLSIPDEQYFLGLEEFALENMSPEERQNWLDAKEEIGDELGLSVDELLGAVGPEFLYITDAAGDYAALRLRNAATWDRIAEAISAKTGQESESREVEGGTIHYWRLPSLYSFGEPSGEPGDTEILELMGRLDEHVFWTRQGDFLFLAGIPQPLMDRLARGANFDVADWLENTQRQDVGESVLLLSAQTRKLPRRLYYAHLEFLQVVADLAQSDYDVWSLATADQLGLPQTGAIGLTVNIGEPVLSLELMFESNPLEGIIGSGGTAVALVGMLAAIAIPAYQDYTQRAQVGSAFTIVSGAKTALAEFAQVRGRYPTADDLASLELDATIDGQYASFRVDADTGVITVTMGGADTVGANIAGGTIVFTPPDLSTAPTYFLFTCFSPDISQKFLPNSCVGQP